MPQLVRPGLCLSVHVASAVSFPLHTPPRDRCPNSRGQVQAADIGIMGAPAKAKDPATGKMKAVPGCNIFVGGKIGEDAYLSCEPYNHIYTSDL